MSREVDAVFDAALEQCDSEPVHIPGQIQDNGALIGVELRSNRICYASENTSTFLGVSALDLLGSELDDVFEASAVHSLSNGIVSDDAGLQVNDLGVIRINDLDLTVTASYAPNCTVFEFEQAQNIDLGDSTRIRGLEVLLQQIRVAKDEQELCALTTETLQMITGYDRVMVYKFDPEGNGQIVGESVVSGVDSFLGLNFPKWDIPTQARKLMAKIPLRYVNDIFAEQVPVLAADATMPDLDMTFAHLRGHSMVHLKYLENMEVTSTFSLNISFGGEVWGMISFHHMTKRVPSQSDRQICRNFASVFATHVQLMEQLERSKRLERANSIRRSINTPYDGEATRSVFEKDLLKELCDVMEADGAALVHGGMLVTQGNTPSNDRLVKLISSASTERKVLYTCNVENEFEELAEIIGSNFSGILISRLPDDCTFVFFRHDRAFETTWAGAPEKDLVVERGVARLQPRSSFALFTQEVTGTSEPWSAENISLANDLWSLLITAEREELIEKTTRQQSLLIDELNHRVRNILSLVRSLSQQTLEHNGSIESYVSALDARIASVSAAHDLGAEKSSYNATVQQIIGIEANPYNHNSQLIKVSGDD